jgi:hypothetical protein
MSDNKPKHLPPVETRFKPGVSGNPGGKPKSSRNRLQGDFMLALANDFAEHGKKAIETARVDDPVGYMKVVASLMPKQMEQTQPLDDLTDAELTAGIALLRSRLAGGTGAGSESPQEPQSTH